MEGNNISGKIANDRDIWLRQEETLLKELMKKIENQIKVEEYNRGYRAEDLYNDAISLIEEIESGELDDETIKKKVEEITLLFNAIKDYIKDAKERSKDPYNPYNNPHKYKDDGRDDR